MSKLTAKFEEFIQRALPNYTKEKPWQDGDGEAYRAIARILEAVEKMDKRKIMSRLNDILHAYQSTHPRGESLCFCSICEPELGKFFALLSALPDEKEPGK